MTTDESALLAAIRANPADDAPRLIYADWLDENGESAHAELIRVQIELARNEVKYSSCGNPNLIPHLVTSTPWLTRCRDCNWSHGPFWSHTAEQIQMVKSLRRRERELLSAIMDNLPDGCRIDDGRPSNSILVKFSRGFVSHVTADWITLVGGRCYQCIGYGVVCLPINHSDYMRRTSAECNHCTGTGLTNGTLPKIVRSRCAAVERVSVTNKSPLFFHSRYHWRLDGVGQYQINDRHDIDIKIWWDHPVNRLKSFSTAEDANTALSTALIRWAWSVDPEASNVDAAR